MFQLVKEPNEESEEIQKNEETDLNISFLILMDNLAVHIDNNMAFDIPTCVSAKVLKDYLNKLKNKHYNKIKTRSYLLQELFLLHQITRSLQKYYEDILDISYIQFRAKVYYPNVVYILIRLLPNVRKFFQSTIRILYLETKRKSYGVIQLYTNSFYLDQDIIKTDILYNFLGNGMKKFNPLLVNNIQNFYKQVFRKIISYYFKSEQRIHSEIEGYSTDEMISELTYIPTGVSIYRDVMYSLQVEQIYSESPTLNQIKYNYSIFRNVILKNELQNIYLSSKKDTFLLNSNQYKLTHIYKCDIESKLDGIKKLPTVYRLLKSVHIVKEDDHNVYGEKSKLIEAAVLEELIFPFRKIFSYENLYEILKKVAKNFTESLLIGEYINLITLTPIKINQITFINQIRLFIRMCLEADTHEEN